MVGSQCLLSTWYTIDSETHPCGRQALLTEITHAGCLRLKHSEVYSFEVMGDILLLLVFAYTADLDHVVTSHNETQIESTLTLVIFSEMNGEIASGELELNFSNLIGQYFSRLQSCHMLHT